MISQDEFDGEPASKGRKPKRIRNLLVYIVSIYVFGFIGFVRLPLKTSRVNEETG